MQLLALNKTFLSSFFSSLYLEHFPSLYFPPTVFSGLGFLELCCGLYCVSRDMPVLVCKKTLGAYSV